MSRASTSSMITLSRHAALPESSTCSSTVASLSSAATNECRWNGSLGDTAVPTTAFGSMSPSERFVTMFPAGVMRRMRPSSPSATRMLPPNDESSPSTRWNLAAVAGPLSPREASSVTSAPVPATMVGWTCAAAAAGASSRSATRTRGIRSIGRS